MNKMLCKRLKMLRLEEGKLQADIAQILDINRSTYGAYELGKIAPPSDKLQKLSEYYHVSVDFLLGKSNSRMLSESETGVTDASQVINTLIKHLDNETDNISMDGMELNTDAREMLSDSLKNTLKIAKLLQKS